MKEKNNKSVDPSSNQTVLMLAAGVVTLVILSFFLIRKSPQPPVKLQLGNETPKTPKELLGGVNGEPLKKQSSARPSAANKKTQDRYAQAAKWLEEKDTDPAFRAPPAREKSLNVLFNWNGHTWDAYEVLGVAAGSSMDSVTQAFNRARAQADEESQAFLKAALEAIASSLR